MKPENKLYSEREHRIAIADFGIARFTDDVLVTMVETSKDERLANFQYAAPEQRTRGGTTSASTDMYALGLILNEMFTGVVRHGTDYRRIGDASREFGYLDAIVEKMLIP